MTTRETMMTAGARLRALREKAEITQQEMERRTADRFGPENRVYAQQLSRIEKGQLDKPPILDLLRIGQVLGLTPDDIAEMYDLWPRTSKRKDPRLQAAEDLAEQLTGADLESFLELIAFATLKATADLRAKQRAQGSEPPAPPQHQRGVRREKVNSGPQGKGK